MEYPEYRNKVIELGEEAFNAILNRKRKPCEIKNKTPLMIEYARHGENYLNLGNDDVKLMVVGRAPGSFCKDKNEEKNKVGKIECNVIDYTISAPDTNKVKYCFDTHYYEEDHLSWIHKEKEEKGERYIDAKPFFSLAKAVFLELTKKKQDFEWYKSICHSNIYKIVPTCGGNPNVALRKAQEDAMAEILNAEIQYYKPTHILVIDSRTSLHCFCSDSFKESIKECAKNNGAKISFSDRPEINKNSDLVKFIREDFDLKN